MSEKILIIDDEQDNTLAENQKLLAEKDAELLRLQKELAKLKQL